MKQVVGLIAAAGQGRRLGVGMPKSFVPLGGAALFLWSLRALEATEDIGQALLVVPAGYEQQAHNICQQAQLGKLSKVVSGGPTRFESVYNGLSALLSRHPDIVVIHDAARPFVTPQLIAQSVAVCGQTGAAITAVPAADTLKQVGDDGVITATANRRQFYQAQTPQTFKFDLIFAAYQQAREKGWDVTDDAALVEKMGEPVTVVPGNPHNFKITTPADWERAEAMVASSQQIRVGHGYDVHPLVEGRALLLGGVRVPYERGLAGHSDGDVMLHAIADALLGAAGQGDIGQHFPDTDPAYKDADSKVLLAQVVDLLREGGYQPVNVDVTVIAQQPRLAPYIEPMRQQLGAILNIGVDHVNVKATTTEGLGFIGHGEAIATHAVALIRSQTAPKATGHRVAEPDTISRGNNARPEA